MNISSAIVSASPARMPQVQHSLGELPGVQVHAATEDGRLVVTIETENDRSAIASYEAIERLEGVLNVAMIFQQTEPHPDQEVSHASHTS